MALEMGMSKGWAALGCVYGVGRAEAPFVLGVDVGGWSLSSIALPLWSGRLDGPRNPICMQSTGFWEVRKKEFILTCKLVLILKVILTHG